MIPVSSGPDLAADPRDPDAPSPDTPAEGAPAAPDSGEVWSALLRSDAFSPATYWLAVPEVGERYQRLASGGLGPPFHWVLTCLAHFPPGSLPAARMLSLGCGAGTLELMLARHGAFRRCDAWDLAAGGIEQARAAARAAGEERIEFAVADLETAAIEPGTYDAVWFNSSLHHVTDLEGVLARVARGLKPEGLLFLHEYVGAPRFDFPERQRAAIRAAFALIPERFRHLFGDRAAPVLHEPLLPTPAEVEAADPSESPRSHEILAAVAERFEIVARHDAGGSLLQFVLHGIAGNFRAADPDSLRVLRLLCEIEDTLLAVGDLPSDFTVVVARPRPASSLPAVAAGPRAGGP